MPSQPGPTEPRTPDPAESAIAPPSRKLPTMIAAAATAMLVCLLGLVWFCRSLLVAAAAGQPSHLGGPAFWLAVGGFLLTAGTVVVLQALRVADHVAGPEYRLRRALQRVRQGDVEFRITLREGDLLTGLAQECNELFAWLSKNPPGVSAGSEVVAVAADAKGKAE